MTHLAPLLSRVAALLSLYFFLVTSRVRNLHLDAGNSNLEVRDLSDVEGNAASDLLSALLGLGVEPEAVSGRSDGDEGCKVVKGMNKNVPSDVFDSLAVVRLVVEVTSLAWG